MSKYYKSYSMRTGTEGVPNEREVTHFRRTPVGALLGVFFLLTDGQLGGVSAHSTLGYHHILVARA